MTIRDVIKEIVEVRARRQFGSSMPELSTRLSAIEQAFQRHDKKDAEAARYFPVAIIACLEGYLRMAVKDLVDHGDPYLTNASTLASSIKLDFALLKEIHGRTITIGELIGHQVRMSRLEHINWVFSELLGKDFLGTLSTTTNRWSHEVLKKPAAPILSAPDDVYASVAKAFEIRHIICHELASAYVIEYEQVAQCVEAGLLFLRAAEELISETMDPGAPLTQTEMNIRAGDELGEAEGRLEQAVTTLKRRLDERETARLDESQKSWLAYRDSWIKFVAGERQGTIWPLIAARTAQPIVERRIEEVTSYRRLGDPA